MLTHVQFETYYADWLGLPFEEWVNTEAGFITQNTQLGHDGGPTELDDWQVFNLNNPANYQLYDKSRQVGFSWTQSLKKLARSFLVPKYNGIFLSINLLEAQEKLRYYREAWETLPTEIREGPLAKVKDNALEIEHANGARVTSFPSKAPRGRAGADITFDEAAHVKGAKAIYDGTTAASVRNPSAGMEVGSSPLGATGLFYELVTDPEGVYRSYNGQRFFIHWWDSSGLCADVMAARLSAVAERWDLRKDYASVQSRVERFATDRFKLEFYSKSLDAFLQEFECQFVSDQTALVGIDYIDACSDPDLEYLFHPEGKPSSPIVLDRATEMDVKTFLVPRVVGALMRGLPPGTSLYAGFDPARSRNQSVVTVVGPTGAGDEYDPMRVRVYGRVVFRDTPVHVQQGLVEGLLACPYVKRVAIDRTGIGVDLSDRLAAGWGETVATGLNFTLQSKAELSSRLVHLYERRGFEHPYDRDLRNQVAALRKVVTAQGNVKITAPDVHDNHADAAWSLALAAYFCPDPQLHRIAKLTLATRADDETRRLRRELIDELRHSRSLERNRRRREEV